MSMRKPLAKIVKEGRSQEPGENYNPTLHAEEARSIGTASRIWDPVEGRFAHTMSKTETLVYAQLRGDPKVVHIREQYLLDPDLMREIKKQLGMRDSGKNYTTDFLVDYEDGTQRAFSVKWSTDLFDENSARYKGRHKAYVSLINRVNLEHSYWKALGVDFYVITKEMVNRTYATNILTLLHAWYPYEDPTLDLKTLYLVAHGFITTDLQGRVLNPKRIREELRCDIDALYNDCINSEKGATSWLRLK